jgi:hypothetical protein
MLGVPLSSLVKELLLLRLKIVLAHQLFMLLGIFETLFAWVFALDADLCSSEGHYVIMVPCYTAEDDLLSVSLNGYDPIRL